MVAQEFIGQLDKLHFVDGANLHDFADRCAYLLSFAILVICFTIVTLKSYVFDPLSCYTATTFSGSNMLAYINAFCWVNGTVPANVSTDKLDDPAYWAYLETKKINYYQWVSLVLALQAILCYLPSLFWEALTFNRIGSNLTFYIETAQAASRETGENRTKRVQFLASALDTLIYARRKLQYGPKHNVIYNVVNSVRNFIPHKRLGRALCAYYFIIKCLYLANAVFQVIIMEKFLRMDGDYQFFGIKILEDLWHGHYWQETLVFPRTGYCRVPLKLVGQPIPTVVAQCAMPVNMLNEKVYIFLWFWFVGVAILESASICIWIFRICVRKRRIRSLIRYLKIADVFDESQRDIVKHFEAESLKPDGAFLLYMLRLNAGDIITNEVLQALFERYLTHEKAAQAKRLQETMNIISTPNQDVTAREIIADNSTLKQRFV